MWRVEFAEGSDCNETTGAGAGANALPSSGSSFHNTLANVRLADGMLGMNNYYCVHKIADTLNMHPPWQDNTSRINTQYYMQLEGCCKKV